jgi:hypothetical protein
MKTAVNHHKTVLLKSGLFAFKDNAIQRIQNRLIDPSIIQYKIESQSFQIKRIFKKWIQISRESRHDKSLIYAALNHYQIQLTRKSWFFWCESIQRSLLNINRLNHAIKHYRIELLTKGINAFINNACIKSKKKLNEIYAKDQLEYFLVKSCFSKWSSRFELLTSIRNYQKIADDYRKYSLASYYHTWTKVIPFNIESSTKKTICSEMESY